MGEAIAGLEVPVACWRTNLTSQVLRSSLLGVDKAHCRLGVARLLMWDAGLMMITPLLMIPSLLMMLPLLDLSHRRWDVGGLLLVGWLVRHTFLKQKRSTTDLLHTLKGLYMCENTYLRCVFSQCDEKHHKTQRQEISNHSAMWTVLYCIVNCVEIVQTWEPSNK